MAGGKKIIITHTLRRYTTVIQRVFASEEMHAALEEQARSNTMREIAMLESGVI